MNLHIISTGSQGNCYLLTDDRGRVIALDAGVRIKRILEALRFDLSILDGALITHEHNDHSAAVQDLIQRGIPVHMTPGTNEALGECAQHSTMLRVGSESANYETIRIGSWWALPLEVQHDAVEPVCFLLGNAEGHRIMYATDTYYLRYKPSRLTHIIVECNYITAKVLGDDMAARKNRLLHSHMSLENLKKWLKAIDLTHCVKIILVHLSDANSDEKKMVEEIERQTGIETIAAADGLIINLDLTPF